MTQRLNDTQFVEVHIKKSESDIFYEEEKVLKNKHEIWVF